MNGEIRLEDLVADGGIKASPRPAAPSPEQIAAQSDRGERLASYMTHELRAPLTSVRSALGILQEQLTRGMDPEQRHVLAIALKNADRLDSLINDIMDFSKINAGKLRMNSRAFLPDEAILEAIESLRAWATAKGVRLVRVESEEPLPMVWADFHRTVQVLVNLLSNAIKFSPQGGKVEVSAALGRHEHRDTILFKVKDGGPGIPHADLERIFGCFEQSSNGIKASEGTGLGLTLAKAMVELQGGRIWAESWKGLGATFLFTLPRAAVNASKPLKTYAKPVQYHGLLVGVFRRLNSVVAALFA